MTTVTIPPRRTMSAPAGVLNPGLYQRVRSQLGDARVVAGGSDAVGSAAVREDGMPWTRFLAWGEAYAVDCPFCGDSRKRLYVNHRYGTADPESGLTLYPARCFNEDCLSDPVNRRTLRDRLVGFLNPEQRDALMACRTPTIDWSAPLPEMPLPTDCFDLRGLHDDHRARTYLQGRGFDPEILAREHGLLYCRDGRCDGTGRRIGDRIIIPVNWEGRRVGWQARSVGAPADGEPKYLSAPGFPKTRVLYGYDRAVAAERLVIVEGIADAWRVGPGGVALFGRSIAPPQEDLVASWARIGGRSVIVALDADAEAATYAVAQRLRDRGVRPRIARVPAGRDPADLAENELRRVLDAAEGEPAEL